jgi:hypothetical protein
MAAELRIVEDPADRVHPLPPFTPHQDVQSFVQDGVRGSMRIEQVIAVGRRVGSAQDPWGVEALGRSAHELDERGLLHRHAAGEHGVRSRSTFKSISSNSQFSGMKAANVIKPRGGKAAFLPIIGMMWR